MFDLFRALQAVLGIGLVIFIHEAGHFLAARWCGVRVEVFSLGFGPRLFGFRRGGTLYQLAVVPVGGFVAMAGEHAPDSGRVPASDELGSKSVGQRFLVYSGGVLMNLLSALVVFPILFWHGVPFVKPVVGAPSPGGPAWTAGVPPGAEVLAINGEPVFDGMHVVTEVAIGGGDSVRLLIRDPEDGSQREVDVAPRYDELRGIRRIDLGLPAADPEHRVDVEADSPAWRAGLRSGDRLLGVGDLPRELRLMAQLEIALARGSTLELEVERDGQGARTVALEPALDLGRTRPRLGILPARAEVVGLRPGGPLDGQGLAVGDRLISVGERRIVRPGDLLLGLLQAEGPTSLTLDRPEPEVGAGAAPGAEGELARGPRRYRRLTIELPPLARETVLDLDRHLALGPDSSGLLLAVTPGEGGYLGGLRDGDRLLSIDGNDLSDWAGVIEAVGLAVDEGRPLRARVERTPIAAGAGAELIELEAQAIEQPELALGARFNEYGFAPRTWDYVYRATGPIAAMRVGLATSWLYVEQTWLTLAGMLRAEVSTRNIGGPVAIGQISYSFAESGWPKLLYFLCMLSVNLGLINLLPVPVLDGGHLLFLIVEKVKGSPVSERVVGYSQLVGVVLIVGLMVYVTFNDIRRVLGL